MLSANLSLNICPVGSGSNPLLRVGTYEFKFDSKNIIEILSLFVLIYILFFELIKSEFISGCAYHPRN